MGERLEGVALLEKVCYRGQILTLKKCHSWFAPCFGACGKAGQQADVCRGVRHPYGKDGDGKEETEFHNPL